MKKNMKYAELDPKKEEINSTPRPPLIVVENMPWE